MISNPQSANSPVATRATDVTSATLASSSSVYIYGPSYALGAVQVNSLITVRPSYLVIQNQGAYNLELRLAGGAQANTGSIIIAPLATYEVAVDISAGIELYNPNPTIFVPITGITQANPGVVTTGSAHAMTAGQEFQIYDVGGMVEVNNLTFVAMAGVAGTTINLSADGAANFDTSLFTPYTAGGTVAYTTFVPTAFSVTQF
tara:strand:- start:6 stop:614 length:609 start_codon:yes stop_codon:yes gene_type:complete